MIKVRGKSDCRCVYPLTPKEFEQLLLISRVLNVYRLVLPRDLACQMVPSQDALCCLIINTEGSRRVFDTNVLKDCVFYKLVPSFIRNYHITAQKGPVLFLWYYGWWP